MPSARDYPHVHGAAAGGRGGGDFGFGFDREPACELFAEPDRADAAEPEPRIVIVVPPASEPALGWTPVMSGASPSQRSTRLLLVSATYSEPSGAAMPRDLRAGRAAARRPDLREVFARHVEALDAVVARIDDPQRVVPSIVIAIGSLNWPLPEPAIPLLHSAVQVSSFASPSFTPQPNASLKVPSGEYSSTRSPSSGRHPHVALRVQGEAATLLVSSAEFTEQGAARRRELLHVAVTVVANPHIAAESIASLRAMRVAICFTYSPLVVNSWTRSLPPSIPTSRRTPDRSHRDAE